MIVIGKSFVRMIKYWNGIKRNYLTLSDDDLKVIKRYVEGSFAVNPDFNSCTGEIMNMGKGATSQFLGNRSLT